MGDLSPRVLMREIVYQAVYRRATEKSVHPKDLKEWAGIRL